MNVIHYRKQQDDAQERGRPRLYDGEERKQRHREAALAAYHRSGKTTRASRKAPCFFAEMGDKDREALRATSS
jgi:hypothetical protein